MFPLFLFQDPTAATQAVEETVKEFSLIEIISSGGIMSIANIAVEFVLALIAIWIIVERYYTIKNAGKVDENFMNLIKNHMQNGNVEAALNECRNSNTAVSRLVAKGLQRIGKPLSDIRSAVENIGNLEVFKLEARLSTLATISGAAPMIGFLGTVTGMIQAFFEMSSTNNVTPQTLSGGIYQSLVTTAIGLIVGIIAFIAYNIFIAQVDRVVFKMEAATVDFLDLLQETP